ncbi:MAG: polyphosphate polymerase domain-containing protein [Cyclobacteriaceae bacterium]|nr:polyphosphate polymerase domain-containing protein [Cyclobacteriaceae bacterium]
MQPISAVNTRFELKYRIQYHIYLRMRNALMAYMKKDKYTRASQDKGYLVRSLYYDTHQYRSYHEKMSGDNERVKFRIRTYSHQLQENTRIRVELKGRKSGLVIKKSCVVSPDEYLHFIKTGHWISANEPVLTEFERYLYLQDLQPKIITQYYREGYETRINSDVRITFDHDVRSAHAESLFPEHAFYKEHNHNSVVLEIKFSDDPPKWVTRLSHQYGLRVVANSKFTQGIQIARKDLYHPGGIVTVR